MNETLSRKEREILEIVECQGDDVDVSEVAAALDISTSTLRTKVRRIRAKLDAHPAQYWLEDLPERARSRGIHLRPCTTVMPDDGVIRVDGTTAAL